MRKVIAVLVLATGALFVLSPLAEACGDKLLSIARGIRLQHAYKAQHPTSILLYVGDVEAASKSKDRRKALVQMSILYMSLRQAGHGLEVVENPSDLARALGGGDFDFVMTDVRDVEVVTEQVALRAAPAEVLPVLFKPKKADFAAAEKDFTLVLKTPATSVAHLEAIDRVMESRSQGAPTS